MNDTDLDFLAERVAEKVLARLSVLPQAQACEATGTAEGYPEKLSRTQAARFVGGKPFKRSAAASGTDHTLLRELRVKPILTRHHFRGRETTSRDYFLKSALSTALASRAERN